ncbi:MULTISPECIES: D-alanyl-D-alanine endopeptidase [unclassified Pseudomonas]|uniref:D-alanyl-D-alanine endopeptidase n=1 Tax=unclassified Pseudomonas TaxID=196821 RepID=UPI002ACB18BD|nr:MULTISPECIES: D-alanyl-D-alanine endopeptidase [unclassified Pseudomonas]MEB0039816.1 D-alanyl-D-alanine endopeptidase [Pseudomonas sp. MH10]MEB0091427.1 D-alanyl-D-alanine endopeptidase [Pseudomonas sp. CCI4.2]MEB0120698.1 D-alanyl-D-alanine endopeptidase [Pseudomonas sp. CCI1.2]WPX52471.1 D-alanyl-D-alanine endopeptidase [Pseudomonas sp. CCI4.2]WPX64556.1 D-alanyl-D-alanine endopeptidase [Pseudomonas sp. MH10]
MKIRHSLLSLLFVCTGAALTDSASANEPAPFNRDPSQLHLASGSAMVVDLKTNNVLFANNPDVVVPIASVTKLMTAIVVLDAKLPMNEMIPVSIVDTKEMKGVFSRVKIGSELDRKTMLQIALMSSENRAAASLAHSYPGGYSAFIIAMNAKAKSLGMKHTVYVEPTGLSVYNVSTARDLSKLALAARQYPMLSELSTTPDKTVTFHKPTYSLVFNNTDHLIKKSNWDIKLTKTGFTNQAGHCLVLLTTMANRQVSVVILDAFGKYTHFADAGRLRNWMETGKSGPAPQVAVLYKNEKNMTMQQIGIQAKE